MLLSNIHFLWGPCSAEHAQLNLPLPGIQRKKLKVYALSVYRAGNNNNFVYLTLLQFIYLHFDWINGTGKCP